MRHALWITRFDWDDGEGLTSLLQRAIDGGVTDLLMQARGAGDALYRSDVAPASARVAECLGGEPAWDPLTLACEFARGHSGIRVHAWVNVLSGWPATSRNACEGLTASSSGRPDHLLLRHPDAVLVDTDERPMLCPNDTDYIWVSPRHPGVIAEIEAVTTELVERYPLAGIHLDRIRYPGGPWVDRVARTRDPEAVTNLVRRIRASIPGDVELTAALVPDHSARRDGRPDHLAEFGQDGWRWVSEGIVDSIMPMVYTPITAGAPDDWARLVEEHLDAVGRDRCWAPVFAGLGDTMIGLERQRAERWSPVGIAWYSAGLLSRHDRWMCLHQS